MNNNSEKEWVSSMLDELASIHAHCKLVVETVTTPRTIYRGTLYRSCNGYTFCPEMGANTIKMNINFTLANVQSVELMRFVPPIISIG